MIMLAVTGTQGIDATGTDTRRLDWISSLHDIGDQTALGLANLEPLLQSGLRNTFTQYWSVGI